jgi:hypothetical protein
MTIRISDSHNGGDVTLHKHVSNTLLIQSGEQLRLLLSRQSSDLLHIFQENQNIRILGFLHFLNNFFELHFFIFLLLIIMPLSFDISLISAAKLGTNQIPSKLFAKTVWMAKILII